MDLQLNGRIALVTGAARGLGLAIARALAAEGAVVVGTGRTHEALETIAAVPGDTIALRYDARESDSATRLLEEVRRQAGGLQILVNNAAIAPTGRLEDRTIEDLRAVLEVNVIAPVALIMASLPLLRAGRDGRVVNVASVAGLRAQPTVAGYSASKAALLRVTEALAFELADDGIRVNALALGAFATEMQGEILDDPELYERRVKRIPSRRMGSAEEAGHLVCYLASPLSDFVTGATYVIDGGESARI